ncbi:hypothetical protein ACH35V_37160 [Actinomadura sp. 1N219]|uniref:hypothetical protein n=1 Tax=Actinomadura sp. 1N219 TaxID=3375152 RepID=UPI0037BD6610
MTSASGGKQVAHVGKDPAGAGESVKQRGQGVTLSKAAPGALELITEITPQRHAPEEQPSNMYSILSVATRCGIGDVQIGNGTHEAARHTNLAK